MADVHFCPKCGKSFTSNLPDSEGEADNLLLNTIVSIRIATKLITPMLTELPGEVKKLVSSRILYREALENIAATTCKEHDYTFEEAQQVAREALKA